MTYGKFEGIGKKNDPFHLLLSSNNLCHQVILLEVHLPLGRPLHGVFQVAT